MIIKPVVDNKRFPYLLVDDFYTPDEYNLIFEELESFQDIFEYDDSPELQRVLTNSDTDIDFKNNLNGLSNKTRLFLDRTYKNRREESAILSTYIDKIYTDEIIDAYKQTTPASASFLHTNSDYTQISYYEDGDTYVEHFDSVLHTCLIYMHKEPKRFTGGNLIFTESNQIINFKNNRLVIFPSYYMHAVNEVSMNEIYKNKGLGRYCITHFFSITAI